MTHGLIRYRAARRDLDLPARRIANDDTLARYLAPRYWPAWILVAWLRATAVLPWRFAIRSHRLLGRAAWRVLARRRGIVERNLEICFPERDAQQRKRLAREHFENAAICFAELAFAWFAPQERLAGLFEVQGREHLDAALAERRGVIAYSGHFTALEICAPRLKALVPLFAFMYRPRHNPLLDAVQRRGRRRSGHVSFANDDVRAMLRLLRRNAVVWYAADQACSGKRAQLLPFFGEPTMTSTATAQLAKLSGSPIVPFFFCRKADDSGYLLRFHPAIALDGRSDDTTATLALTRLLETWIRECPAQYLWTHRRFRGRPPPWRDPYIHTDAAAHAPGAGVAGDSRRAVPRIWDAAAAPLLILSTALFITVFDNTIFWSRALEATLGDTHQGAVLLSLLAILFCTLVVVLTLAVGRRATKLLAGALLMVAAVTGFFMTRYGVVVDLSMIRNIFETQAREAAPLFTSAFALHVVVYGVAPAIVVALAPVRAIPWRRGLAARLVLLATSVSVLCGAAYANYGPLSFFAQEHRSLRLLINPGYPLYALSSYLTRANDRPPPERVTLAAERDARLARGHKPTLFVLVLGETARADRFSLNGYTRDTNRYTSSRGVASFAHVTSCGTSTADSVPCLFSDLGQARFSHAAAAARESLFGLLQRVGVDAFWRDNSTGCKHVCDAEHFVELAAATDPTYCDETGCFDEILLEGLEELVADTSHDHFIVLHQRGSHGPAYHTDTPEWIKTFHPECALANLRNCSRETLNNAYDNTILYTDYFVSRVIDFLESRAPEYDVGMMYVSDHGESLGENGLYLHGFPYALAPQEQLRVPLLFWAPEPFYAARGIDSACLSQTVGRPLTHDSVFHTILPLFFVSGDVYRSDLDAFAPCRRERDQLLTQLGLDRTGD